jgi:hypothetical protein
MNPKGWSGEMKKIVAAVERVLTTNPVYGWK